MQPYRSPLSGGLPTVVKNLLIINVLLFVAKMGLGTDGYGQSVLDTHLGMYYFTSPNFRPWQIVTHMFMHGNFMHLAVNMFGLFMFGAPVEQMWGPQRFLKYYLLCGLGAAVLHTAVNTMEVRQDTERVAAYGVDVDLVRGTADRLKYPLEDALPLLDDEVRRTGAPEDAVAQLYFDHYGAMVGASGAIFGILLAFGMFFPNVELIMIFLPIPIKAKYFVVLYGLFELFKGLQGAQGDNVAHFAHLGGMIFGFLLIRHWRKKDTYFY